MPNEHPPSRSSHSGHRQPLGARLLDLAQNSRNRSLDGCVKFRATFSWRQFVLHCGVPAKFLNRCIQFGSILKNKLLLLLLLRQREGGYVENPGTVLTE